MTDRPVPAWAHETVHVVDPDPGWPALARRYAGELDALLGAGLDGPVEHIGSTAVPGLPAKPVVDLQAGAADPATLLDARTDALAAAHWYVVPRELDDRPWRRLVVRADPAGRHRLAHLHLMTPDEPRRGHQIRFRDRLRASDALAGEYARIKRAAAARYGDDREAYTRAKQPFVRRVVG